MTNMNYGGPPVRLRPEFSVPSIIAIACAIGSFYAGAALGFVLAILAIAAGAIGCLLAIRPSVRGGLVSMISIVMGLVGIIAAIVKLIR